jgi:hypothetical protein
MFLNMVKPAAAQYYYTEERLPWDSVVCMLKWPEGGAADGCCI